MDTASSAKHYDCNTTCSKCGVHFHCGCKSGAQYCWCFDMPVVEVSEFAEQCLCPNCLKELTNKVSLAYEQARQYR